MSPEEAAGGGDGMGRLEFIWLKSSHGGPMDPVDEVSALDGRGLEGNADFDGRRHVTLIEKEVFDALQEEFGETVEPSMRRANFLVSGITLEGTRDRVLNVGDLRIRIRGETRPCDVMDEACQGLREALSPNWRAGAHGSVLNDAIVRVGDDVRWEEGP